MTSALELPPGTVIGGQYRIIGTIGVGGSGAVYSAHRLGMTQQVALKLMHAGHPESDSERMRFAREAEVVKKLQHPHIVGLLDYGHHEDGTPFLVQPLLEGETLEKKLERGPLGWEQVGALSVHVLRALDQAHGMNIAHRDIKPANIFVSRGVLGEVAQVLDFGLAKVVRGDLDNELAVTRVGAVLGTPRYMAPEQARGEQVGLVADIYSFGLVMSEMLVGHPLIEGANDVQLYAQSGSDRPLTLPPAIVQSPFASVIQRAVAKPLDVRYRLASQMLADVRAVMEHLGGGSTLKPAEADMDATRMLDPAMAVALSTPNATSEKLRDAFNVIAKKRAAEEAKQAAFDIAPVSQPTAPFSSQPDPEPTAMFDLAAHTAPTPSSGAFASVGARSNAAASGQYAALSGGSGSYPAARAPMGSSPGSGGPHWETGPHRAAMQPTSQPGYAGHAPMSAEPSSGAPSQPAAYPHAPQQGFSGQAGFAAQPGFPGQAPYPAQPMGMFRPGAAPTINDPLLSALEQKPNSSGLVVALTVVLVLLVVAVGVLVYLLTA